MQRYGQPALFDRDDTNESPKWYGAATRPGPRTWDGGTVCEYKGKLAEVFQKVPIFTRHPFRYGTEENRFKDEIRREPLRIGEEAVPIATVSKSYSLIQHRDVLSAVFKALKLISIDISEVASSLLLSEYGERMHWSCSIPNFDFDPGDDCPIALRVNCINSVDTTTALEITFSWFRLVCANGMMFGIEDSRLRKRHVDSLDPQKIASYLNAQLDRVPQERSLYAKWIETPVESGSVIDWIDTTVAKEWGPHIAARTWSIVTTGFDGEVQQVKDSKPHELPVTAQIEVPGAFAPVRNVYHINQALSWIAGTRRTITEQLEYVKATPRLIDALIEQ